MESNFIVDESKKYVCSYILRKIMPEDEWIEYLENSFLMAGAVIVSDKRDDHWILEFFKDDSDVTDFIVNQIVIPTEEGKLTEEFLAELAFKRTSTDKVFLTLPMIVAGTRARSIADAMYKKAETIDFVFQDAKLKDFLEI